MYCTESSVWQYTVLAKSGRGLGVDATAKILSAKIQKWPICENFWYLGAYIHIHIHSSCTVHMLTYTLLVITEQVQGHLHVHCVYRISSIKRPGVYFFRDEIYPAFKWGRRLYGAGVYFSLLVPAPYKLH